MKKEDLTGKMFGRLKVIKEDPNRGKEQDGFANVVVGIQN